MKIELSKEMQEKVNKLVDMFTRLGEAQLTSYNRPQFAVATPMRFDEPGATDEEKALVEAWVKEVDPVIKKEAEVVLADQIREMVLMGGNVKAIASTLKKGKKPKLVRKKEGRRDPLYIQIGDGLEEPIEEIYVFG